MQRVSRLFKFIIYQISNTIFRDLNIDILSFHLSKITRTCLLKARYEIGNMYITKSKIAYNGEKTLRNYQIHTYDTLYRCDKPNSSNLYCCTLPCLIRAVLNLLSWGMQTRLVNLNQILEYISIF